MSAASAVRAWPAKPAPGIKPISCLAADALLQACKAVDRDIERAGQVSAETVDQVRAALQLAK